MLCRSLRYSFVYVPTHETREQGPMERGATCGGSQDGEGWEGGTMGKEAMPIKRAVNSSGQDRATVARVSGDGAN
jgi:hypothetical protein